MNLAFNVFGICFSHEQLSGFWIRICLVLEIFRYEASGVSLCVCFSGEDLSLTVLGESVRNYV